MSTHNPCEAKSYVIAAAGNPKSSFAVIARNIKTAVMSGTEPTPRQRRVGRRVAPRYACDV